MEIQDIINQIVEFFKLFKAEENEGIIKVDCKELNKFDPDIYNQLINEPKDTIKAFEIALAQLEKKGLKITLINLETKKLKIWELSSKYFNKLIQLEGTVQKKSKVHTFISATKYSCPSCGNIITIPQEGETIREPKGCGCGRKGKFTLMDKEYDEAFYITISEDYEGDFYDLKARLSRIFLSESYKEILDKGNVVNLIGVLEPKTTTKAGLVNRSVGKTLLVNNIELIGKEEQSANTDYDRLFNSISPKMFEELVARLFRKKGYNAKATTYTGDKGIDVVAEKAEERIAIQCKLFDKNAMLSNSTVQKAIGSAVSPYKANKVMDKERKAREEYGMSDLDLASINEDRDEDFLPTEKSIESYIKDSTIKEDKIAISDIISKAEEWGHTKEDVDKVIDKLKRKGYIFEPRRGWISRI